MYFEICSKKRKELNVSAISGQLVLKFLVIHLFGMEHRLRRDIARASMVLS